MKGKPNPDRVDRLISINAEKIDKKLEDMLDEFDNYDYTYKPLLTQAEFEEEFLVLIEKILKKRNRYEIIKGIFDELFQKSLKDQHKFLCLIDFTINISKYDPRIFKNLPNDVMSNVFDTPMFSKVKEFIYNKGRMNYHFKKFAKHKYKSNEYNNNNNHLYSNDQNIYTTENSMSEEDIESNSESESERNSNRSNKVIDVSLAELTKKIMSKTIEKKETKKQNIKRKGTKKSFELTEKDEETQTIKEEKSEDSENMLDEFVSEGESDSSDILSDTSISDKIPNTSEKEPENENDDNYELSDDNSEEPTSPKISTRRTKLNSSKSELENLVESDQPQTYSSDETNDEDEDNHINNDIDKEIKNQKLILTKTVKNDPDNDYTDDENIDLTMSNATSIMEHIIDFKESQTPVPITRIPKRQSLASKIKKTNKLVKISLHNNNEITPNLKRAAEQSELAKKRKHSTVKLAGRKKKERNIVKSPVRRKAFFVIEKNLDFLYSGLERFLPASNALLMKNEVKSIIYKPAQYSIFENLPEKTSAMDIEIAKNADSLLNTFIMQMSKRCNGNEIDENDYIHPFEYDYVMKNLEELKKNGAKLPPIIFNSRYGTLIDDDGSINTKLTLLDINDTKVKGLIRLSVFQSEDQYFQQFKKIVPRDQVAKRLKLINKLITDGKSLYIFEFIDEIQGIMSLEKYQIDSEEEEAKLIAQQRKQLITMANSDKNKDETQSMDSIGKTKLNKNINNEINITNEANTKITIENNADKHEIAEDGDNNKDKNKEKNVDENKEDDKIQNENKGNINDGDFKDEKIGKTDDSDISPEYPTNSKVSEEVDAIFNSEGRLTMIELEQRRRMERAKELMNEKKVTVVANDDRTTVYCSSKGVRVSTNTVRKVLSTKKTFELMANIFFPRLRLDSSFKGIPPNATKTLGYAYDGFRPYLISLFISDVFEFLRLPRFFKLDSVMFELQIQDLMGVINRTTKLKNVYIEN